MLTKLRAILAIAQGRPVIYRTRSRNGVLVLAHGAYIAESHFEGAHYEAQS